MQHATCNMQQHEACDIQHGTWKHLVPLVEEAVPDAQHRLHVRHHLRPCMRIFRRTARSDGGDAPSPCVTNERCRMCCVLYGVRCMPASRQRARHCLEVPCRMSPQQPNVLQCSGGAARWHSRLLSERTLYSKLRLKRQMNHSTAYRYAERLQCISIGSALASGAPAVPVSK